MKTESELRKHFSDTDIPSQLESSKRTNPDTIPSGATIPIEMILHTSLPNRLILDIGAGGADKAKILHEHGYAVLALDINPEAIKKARDDNYVVALTIDVTDTDAIHKMKDLFGFQKPGAIVMEALLCNCTGMRSEEETSWKQVLKNAYALVAPGGYVFIADVLRVDESYPYVASLVDHIFDGNTEKSTAWLKSWEHRYRANRELGLSEGTIVVAKKTKQETQDMPRELGTADDLRLLLHSDEFERFAHHFSQTELLEGAHDAGFEIEKMHYTLWQSRQGRPLPGIIMMARKPMYALQILT